MEDNNRFFSGCGTLLGMSFGLFMLYAGLNYSGFCFAQTRYLNDTERFRILFEIVNQRDTIPIDGGPNYEQIKYESFEQFMESNPDCCMVEPRIFKGMPSSFIDRITGCQRGETILRKYTLYYLDENGDRKSKKSRTATILQNCGKVKFSTAEFFHKFTHGVNP